ncbi:Hypothetical predicted protein [Mytilus galloprovincialis]|uniref:Reverse transcriptase/retrotransposon-derived protein RNase H-like domain-containing protein n=1 Tax=Mytilus galloprovincialis TaxID=29158 RepID=A0A8B6FUS5_MYTGA|nr:Hypothetical predicted protein [Mytilus galloprovincialis]
MEHPLDKGDFILDIDVSNVAIGTVLSQIKDGRPRVIAYGSRTLEAECNYCITDKELLAANKPPVKEYMAPLGSMPTGGPWDRLATDIVESPYFPEAGRDSRLLPRQRPGLGTTVDPVQMWYEWPPSDTSSSLPSPSFDFTPGHWSSPSLQASPPPLPVTERNIVDKIILKKTGCTRS